MSAPEPAPARSAQELHRAVDQLLATADELARAQAAVDALRAKVDRFVDGHPALVRPPRVEADQDRAGPTAVLPEDPGSSVRRVTSVVTNTAVAFVVAAVGLAIADPVLPRPAVPFFDTPAAASPADGAVPHPTAPSP